MAHIWRIMSTFSGQYIYVPSKSFSFPLFWGSIYDAYVPRSRYIENNTFQQRAEDMKGELKAEV